MRVSGRLRSLVCLFCGLSLLVSSSLVVLADTPVTSPTLSEQLRSIEALLLISERICRTLETRLEERVQQLRSLSSELASSQAMSASLRTELQHLSNELDSLRVELETWKERSSALEALAIQLRLELRETRSSLDNSVSRSEQLSIDFEDFRTASLAEIRSLTIEIWVYRGVIAGLLGLTIWSLIR